MISIWIALFKVRSICEKVKEQNIQKEIIFRNHLLPICGASTKPKNHKQHMLFYEYQYVTVNIGIRTNTLDCKQICNQGFDSYQQKKYIKKKENPSMNKLILILYNQFLYLLFSMVKRSIVAVPVSSLTKWSYRNCVVQWPEMKSSTSHNSNVIIVEEYK